MSAADPVEVRIQQRIGGPSVTQALPMPAPVAAFVTRPWMISPVAGTAGRAMFGVGATVGDGDGVGEGVGVGDGVAGACVGAAVGAWVCAAVGAAVAACVGAALWVAVGDGDAATVADGDGAGVCVVGAVVAGASVVCAAKVCTGDWVAFSSPPPPRTMGVLGPWLQASRAANAMVASATVPRTRTTSHLTACGLPGDQAIIRA